MKLRLFFVFIFFSNFCFAKQIVYSRDGKYVAEKDTHRGVTVIYKIKRGNENISEEPWLFPGVFPNFHISNDGSIIAGVKDEWNHVKVRDLSSVDFKEAVVIEFFHRDGRTLRITLDKFIKNIKMFKKKLKKTDVPELYEWGQILGFDENNRYKIETNERHTFFISPTNGEILEHINNNPVE